MRHPPFFNDYDRGYITLFSVIILGSIGLLTLGTLFSFSIDQKTTLLSRIHGFEARAAAESCVELALLALSLDPELASGTGSHTLSSGAECSYTFTNNGVVSDIASDGTYYDNTQHLSVTAALNETLQITKWTY